MIEQQALDQIKQEIRQEYQILFQELQMNLQLQEQRIEELEKKVSKNEYQLIENSTLIDEQNKVIKYQQQKLEELEKKGQLVQQEILNPIIIIKAIQKPDVLQIKENYIKSQTKHIIFRHFLIRNFEQKEFISNHFGENFRMINNTEGSFELSIAYQLFLQLVLENQKYQLIKKIILEASKNIEQQLLDEFFQQLDQIISNEPDDQKQILYDNLFIQNQENESYYCKLSIMIIQNMIDNFINKSQNQEIQIDDYFKMKTLTRNLPIKIKVIETINNEIQLDLFGNEGFFEINLMKKNNEYHIAFPA